MLLLLLACLERPFFGRGENLFCRYLHSDAAAGPGDGTHYVCRGWPTPWTYGRSPGPRASWSKWRFLVFAEARDKEIELERDTAQKIALHARFSYRELYLRAWRPQFSTFSDVFLKILGTISVFFSIFLVSPKNRNFGPKVRFFGFLVI